MNIIHLFRFAPILGSEAEDYFRKMAYMEERFYESVKSKIEYYIASDIDCDLTKTKNLNFLH